jgi:hypothetical protein
MNRSHRKNIFSDVGLVKTNMLPIEFLTEGVEGTFLNGNSYIDHINELVFL